MSGDNQTQPLHIDGGTYEVKGEGLTYEKIEELRRQEQAQKAWNELTNHPIVQAIRKASQPPPHTHGPFTFLLNQNHNALRGCQSCGTTWIGLMAGTEDSLRWHEVQEPEEED